MSTVIVLYCTPYYAVLNSPPAFSIKPPFESPHCKRPCALGEEHPPPTNPPPSGRIVWSRRSVRPSSSSSSFSALSRSFSVFLLLQAILAETLLAQPFALPGLGKRFMPRDTITLSHGRTLEDSGRLSDVLDHGPVQLRRYREPNGDGGWSGRTTRYTDRRYRTVPEM